LEVKSELWERMTKEHKLHMRFVRHLVGLFLTKPYTFELISPNLHSFRLGKSNANYMDWV
jgi:hypothetical protein